jgi:hypothetical protein
MQVIAEHREAENIQGEDPSQFFQPFSYRSSIAKSHTQPILNDLYQLPLIDLFSHRVIPQKLKCTHLLAISRNPQLHVEATSVDSKAHQLGWGRSLGEIYS